MPLVWPWNWKKYIQLFRRKLLRFTTLPGSILLQMFLCKLLFRIFPSNVSLTLLPYSGSLSPENIGKALNQTKIAAARYYSIFHQKVDAYAQIQWFHFSKRKEQNFKVNLNKIYEWNKDKCFENFFLLPIKF